MRICVYDQIGGNVLIDRKFYFEYNLSKSIFFNLH